MQLSSLVAVGRGGSRKRELEEQSGAFLQIDDVNEEGQVTLRGGSDARAAARQLIEDAVR